MSKSALFSSHTLKTSLAATLLFSASISAYAQDNLGSTLNLKDADINSLITTVSDITGRNFIVDPRVKGKVTVMSSSPMSPDELYGVFLAVLQVHGFAAVPAGPVTKIVPEVGAKQDGGSYFDFGGLADDEIVTRVVEIVNVPAAQLVPILRPLVPQYGHLAAYSPSNMLIISDRAANVERLTQIIERIDQGGDREIEFVRLEFASAADVQRTLSGLLQGEQKKKDPTQEPITILADERTNSILIGGDKASRLQIRALIAHLDIPLDDDGDTQVVYLSYANAETLAPILEGYVQNQTQGRNNAQGKAAAPSGGQSRIVAEPDTNALLITAPPKLMRSIKNVISQLDIRRAQVLVEAILAEVSATQSRELGIDWAILDKDRIAAASILDESLLGGIASAVTTGNAAGLVRSGLNIGGGDVDSNGDGFAILLNALYGDGDTNVLSTPSLVTMDNEEAEISVGQEVPFLTGSFTNNNNGGSVNPFQTIERRDVGLTLGITPQINEGDSIQLKISQEASNLTTSANAAVDLVTNKRTLNTTVLVNDGDILVLGGLMDDNVQESESKVPILGDIPILGALFRSTTVRKMKQNLMIFIRPTIMRDRRTANYYTRKKYQHIRGLQLQSQDRGTRLMFGKNAPVLPQIEQEEVTPTPQAADRVSAPAADKPVSDEIKLDTQAPKGNEPILESQSEKQPRKKSMRGHLR